MCKPGIAGTGSPPDFLELRAVLVVRDVLKSRETVGKGPHVPSSLDVVLTAERGEPGAPSADVPGEEREVDEREDVVRRVVVLGDPESPAELRPIGFRVGMGELTDAARVEPDVIFSAFSRV